MWLATNILFNNLIKRNQYAPPRSCTLIPYTDALPISEATNMRALSAATQAADTMTLEMCATFPVSWYQIGRAHAELQSPMYLVCRLLLEKKNYIHGFREQNRPDVMETK